MSIIKMKPVINIYDLHQFLSEDEYEIAYDAFAQYSYDDNAMICHMPDSEEDGYDYGRVVHDVYVILHNEGLEWGAEFLVELD